MGPGGCVPASQVNVGVTLSSESTGPNASKPVGKALLGGIHQIVQVDRRVLCGNAKRADQQQRHEPELSHEGQNTGSGGNPKPEIRRSKEGRNPNSERAWLLRWLEGLP